MADSTNEADVQETEEAQELTDKEKFIAMLLAFGYVEVEEDAHPCDDLGPKEFYIAHGQDVRQGELHSVAIKLGNGIGYSHFYVDFYFDPDGKFL